MTGKRPDEPGHAVAGVDSGVHPGPMRLARRLAEVLGCSRREATQYIEGGWVTVDGEVVEAPQAEVGEQAVELLPGATLEDAEPATFLLHKPAGMDPTAAVALVVPAHQVADDPSRIRSLRRHFTHLVAPLPLEADASGLMVVTQDAKLRRRLEDDADRIEQELNVEVTGEVALYGLGRLNHGLRDDAGRAFPPAKVSWQNETRLRFAMKGCGAGQLQQMCAAIGLQSVAIKRLRIGRVSMAKLPVGQWRYLGRHERF